MILQNSCLMGYQHAIAGPNQIAQAGLERTMCALCANCLFHFQRYLQLHQHRFFFGLALFSPHVLKLNNMLTTPSTPQLKKGGIFNSMLYSGKVPEGWSV